MSRILQQKNASLTLWVAVFSMFLGLAPVSLAQEDELGSGAIQGGRIRIEIGKAHLLKDVESYEVTDQSILDATPADDGGLILKGISPGTTTLLVRKLGLLGIIVYDVDVVGVDIENVLNVVKAALGEIVGLSIIKEGNIVVLEGDIVSRDDGKRVDRQIEFHGNSILDLTTRSYLANDLALLREELVQAGYDMVTQSELAKDGMQVLIVRGRVESSFQKEEILAAAAKFFGEDRIVDRISIEEPLIEVDVDVYSLDASKARNLGTNTMLNKITNTASTGWVFNTGPGLQNPVSSYPRLTFGIFEDEFLQAAITDGVVTNVSRQHAAVRSGQVAKIENTQDNYLEIAGGLAATLEVIVVGQVLEITPTVLRNGRFETDVAVELSELVSIGQLQENVDVGVAKRRVSSTYVSETDERVVLGGIKKYAASGTQNRTPLLGRIPIVNLLFNSKSRNYDESVHVYFMTLRQPQSFDADDVASSSSAVMSRERVKKGLDKSKSILDRHIRWE